MMRTTQKGQITIPKELRVRYGITPETEMVFEGTDEGILLKRSPQQRVEQLRAAIEKVRGSADAGYTTDEIMRMTRGED